MTPIIFFLIYLPLITGGALLAVKRHEARAIVARFVLLLCLIASGIAVLRAPSASVIRLIADYSIVLGLGRFGRLIIVFVNLFGLLVAMYSRDSEALKDRKSYFPCLLWLVAYSNLVCLSMDFLVFIFGWGATLALLYALLNPASGSGANRALLVVGLGDFSLMLGIFIYVFITGSTIMPQETGAGVYLNNPLSWCAFILMLTGAFAKAGCAPMHTWIPVAAGEAPLEVMAILPASLDKLLGIYILARVCCGFFILNAWASALLLAMGSLTIVFAVLLALVQHDMRKLLSYHAISQVGYMVLGIGTGTAIGLVGGLFHMINHSIYKSGLFLSAGAVGQKEKTFDLEKLGGLASLMPLTFVSALVFSLSISGVPPFNGFVSKWLVYQGALEGASSTPSILLRLVYLVALAAAMLGSALTLASFVKFIHAVFLGQRQPLQRPAPGAVSVGMKASLLMLAALCVILGVLPAAFIRIFIRPWLNQDIVLLGSWNSVLAFLLLLTGVILGF
ncbi:MAG: complex I subunit 5 family protein, partial [Candidatus Omnitrophota bacterium]